MSFVIHQSSLTSIFGNICLLHLQHLYNHRLSNIWFRNSEKMFYQEKNSFVISSVLHFRNIIRFLRCLSASDHHKILLQNFVLRNSLTQTNSETNIIIAVFLTWTIIKFHKHFKSSTYSFLRTITTLGILEILAIDR